MFTDKDQEVNACRSHFLYRSLQETSIAIPLSDTSCCRPFTPIWSKFTQYPTARRVVWLSHKGEEYMHLTQKPDCKEFSGTHKTYYT